MKANPERWLPVVGFEGLYEVSDHGRVRSLDHLDRFGRLHRGRVMRTGVRGHRSHNVGVTLSRQGEKQKLRTVHQLVLEAFVGPRPDGMWGLHWDDDPYNNHLDNLRWGYPYQNGTDAVRNGSNWQFNKTHCVRDHEFTVENTRIIQRVVNGTLRTYRRCRTCHRDREREAKRWRKG